jgi:hypothetical protein
VEVVPAAAVAAFPAVPPAVAAPVAAAARFPASAVAAEDPAVVADASTASAAPGGRDRALPLR